MTMWKELEQWEKRHEAQVYGVIDAQSLIEDLSYQTYFNEHSTSFVCSVEDIPHSLILKAMTSVCNSHWIDSYEGIMEAIAEYIRDALLKKDSTWSIVEKLSSKTIEPEQKGNFYDDVTKKHYKWNELTKLMRSREENKSTHTEFKSYEDWRSDNESR